MNFSKRFICFLLAAVLMFGAVPMNVFAAGDVMYGIAYVDASSLRLRKSAGTNSSIVDTAYRGEVVVVVSKHGDWYKVIYDLQEGYMHSDYLKVEKTGNAELGYGKVNGTNVNLRSGAGTSYKKVAQANRGDKAYIIGIQNGWYKVILGKNVCFIRSDYLDLTEVPYENKSSSNSPKFFKGGKSTGTEPSANALNGTVSPAPEMPKDEPEATTPPATETQKPSTDKDTTTSTTSDGKKYGIAFVTGSGLRLRSAANTSSKTLASAAKGEVVVVLSKHGDWYKVIYNLKEGYMHGDYLNVQITGHAELGYGKVNGSAVNLRSGPGTSNKVVATASKGAKAYILGIQDGWYRVIYGNSICFIRSDFLDLTEAPYENKASAKSPKFYRGGKSTGTDPSADALNGITGSTSTGSVTGQQIVDKAKQYLGVPYKWGGASPSGFDCSGFVYYVMRSLGFNISRTLTTMYAQGTPVSKSELQPGDIVLFKNTYKSGLSHVGIYVGDGKFIHSPSSGKVVSYADLNSTYYIEHYYGAVRYTK